MKKDWLTLLIFAFGMVFPIGLFLFSGLLQQNGVTRGWSNFVGSFGLALIAPLLFVVVGLFESGVYRLPKWLTRRWKP